MKVSFIVPAFNEERYIEPCLNSITALELLEDFEIIVADNESQDRTVSLVSRNFPRVKIVRAKKRGPAAARNCGARVARGELLAFIDADCRLPRDWWQKVSKNFQDEPNIIMLQGPYRYFEKHNFLERVGYFLANEIFLNLIDRLGGRVFRLGTIGVGGDMVVRRRAFWDIGGFNEKFKFYGEDVDLANRLLFHGRVKFSSQVWVYSSLRRFRQNGNFRTWGTYILNGLWAWIFRRPLAKTARIAR